MKELFTEMTLQNGKVKRISVELDDELADWLINQPKEAYKDFLLFEHQNKCIERKETRRIQSLSLSISHGFDVEDEDADVVMSYLRRLKCDEIRKAISILEPQQKWLVNEVFYKNRSQIDIAMQLGVGESAIRSRLKKIFKKIRKII